MVLMSSSSAPPVIIDVDPAGLSWTGVGTDGDLALLISLALEELDIFSIIGVTVVAGSAPLKDAEVNARRLLSLAGIDKPLSSGISWHDQQLPQFLQALNTFSPDRQSSDDAANFIINQTMALDPNTLTILMLGPPSNLARALQIEPRVAERLRRVVLVGGELTGKELDFNFLLDQGALKAIINAPVAKWLAPIQLNAQAAITADWIKDFSERCCNDKTHAVACALQPKMELDTKLMPLLANPAIGDRMDSTDNTFHWKRWKKDWNSLVSQNLSSGFIPWDITGVLVLARPGLFPQWRHARVELPDCKGAEPCESTMTVKEAWKDNGFNVHKIGADWSGVVSMPIELNEAELLRVSSRLVCKQHTTANMLGLAGSEEIGLGAVPVIGGVLLAVVLLLVMCMRMVCASCCSCGKARALSSKAKAD
jgi:inosine-uridine nucleoside N-ribohydrolase